MPSGRTAGGRPTTLGHGLPAEPREPAPTQARPGWRESSQPSPSLALWRRHYLDKTSRSSSADSSRSRVLLPPAAPEPPPGRSFSFSPPKAVAMLLTDPQESVQPRAAAEAKGSPRRREERLARAPPAPLEVRPTGSGRPGSGARQLRARRARFLLCLLVLKQEGEASAQRILSI